MQDLQRGHPVPLTQLSHHKVNQRISRPNIELSRSTSLTSRRRYHSLPSRWTSQPIGIEPTSEPHLATTPKRLPPFHRTFNSGLDLPRGIIGQKDTTQRGKGG